MAQSPSAQPLSPQSDQSEADPPSRVPAWLIFAFIALALAGAFFFLPLFPKG